MAKYWETTSSVLQDVERQIDILFDKLKEKLRSPATPRSAIEQHWQNWLDQSKKAYEWTRLTDYNAISELSKKFHEALTTEEPTDAMLDEYRDKLKMLVRGFFARLRPSQAAAQQPAATQTTPTPAAQQATKPVSAPEPTAQTPEPVKTAPAAQQATKPVSAPEQPPEPVKPAPTAQTPAKPTAQTPAKPATPEPTAQTPPKPEPTPQPATPAPVTQPPLKRPTTPAPVVQPPLKKGPTTPATPAAAQASTPATQTTVPRPKTDEEFIKLGAAIATAMDARDLPLENIKDQDIINALKLNLDLASHQKMWEKWKTLANAYLARHSNTSGLSRDVLMTMKPIPFKKWMAEHDEPMTKSYEPRKWWYADMRREIVDNYFKNIEDQAKAKAKMEAVTLIKDRVRQYKEMLRAGKPRSLLREAAAVPLDKRVTFYVHKLKSKV